MFRIDQKTTKSLLSMENNGNQSKLMDSTCYLRNANSFEGFSTAHMLPADTHHDDHLILRTRHCAQKETNALPKSSDKSRIVMSSTQYSCCLIANPPKGSGYELGCYRVACGHVLIENVLRALTESSKYPNAYSPSASVCTGKSSGMHCPLA